MSSTTLWWVVLGSSAGCMIVKALGHLVPARVLQHARLQRVTTALPVVLLAALVSVQTFVTRQQLAFDHRAAGVAATFVLLGSRRSFLTSVAGGCVVSALVWHAASH